MPVLRVGCGQTNFIRKFVSLDRWPPADGWWGYARHAHLPGAFPVAASEIYRDLIEQSYRRHERLGRLCVQYEIWDDDRYRCVAGNIRYKGRRLYVKGLFYYTILLAIWRPRPPRIFAVAPFSLTERTDRAATDMLVAILTSMGELEADEETLPPIDELSVYQGYYGVIVTPYEYRNSFLGTHWFVWTETGGIVTMPHETPSSYNLCSIMHPPLRVEELNRKADRLHLAWLRQRGHFDWLRQQRRQV